MILTQTGLVTVGGGGRLLTEQFSVAGSHTRNEWQTDKQREKGQRADATLPTTNHQQNVE